MAREAQGPALVDPLANYWGLALFPQTSSVPPDSSKPYNPDADLDTIDNHLRSMALGSPSKLLKQAKSIVDGNPGPIISEVFRDSAPCETSYVVSEEVPENPRERRPALGHKRARFSLKPNRNHLSEILKPSVDIDSLKDPEEFFKAHERLENAKREIQKQTGNILFEPNENNTSTNARHRRPGLMGNNQRRSVRYKHRYSIETSGQKEDIPSSQGKYESGGLDPVRESPEKAEAHPASLRSELANSSAMKENNHNNILDELLHNSEDLEEDQAITLLQESLQIKPIFLEKLSIPDLPANRVTELKTFVGKLSKPRKPLMNIDNLPRDMNSVTPEKPRQNVGNPWQQLASPTPPKSPFALLPSLQKRLSQSKPSVDSFSTLDCTHSSVRNSSQSDTAGDGLKLIDYGKLSDKSDEPLIKDIQISVEKTVRNLATTSGISGEDNSGKPAFGTDIDSNESHLDLEVDAGGRNMNKVINDIVSMLNSEVNDDPSKHKEDTVRTCANTSENSKEDNPKEPAFPADVDSNKSHVNMEAHVGNRVVDDTTRRANYEANEPHKLMEDTVRTCADIYQNSKEVNSPEPAFGINVESNISHGDMELDVGASDVGSRFVDGTISKNYEVNEPCKFKDGTVKACANTTGNFEVDNSTETALGTNVDSNISHVDVEVDIGGSDVGNQIARDTIGRANEPGESAGKVQEVVSSEQTAVAEFNLVNPQDQSGDALFEANSGDGNTNTSDDGPGQFLQRNTDKSQVSVNEQRKVKSRKRKDRGLSRRQSLAVAGTSWESGVRRSTRMRIRPLEYWKGERPVYGRVHESLVTVIGVKCLSPGTADGKPILKTKSYVADEYKGLFDIASLH
ncbi:centromere protein C isoform X2 [Neltuma alba]|uniref:centromere protein C isoform X2 n=1 Tax=Neltuma alba TaxID=207710 RepID=UPI0010A320F5|nr:centromere protein C-like isoform X2 [Prosopis alba]